MAIDPTASAAFPLGANVNKTTVRAWAQAVEDAVELGQAAGFGYQTLAALNADLAHPANTKAEVYADGTPANNGVYMKVGASGTGSWTKISDLAVTTLDARLDVLEGQTLDARLDALEGTTPGVAVRVGAAEKNLVRTQLLLPPKVAAIGDSTIQFGTFVDLAGNGAIHAMSLGEIEVGLALDRRGWYTNWIKATDPVLFDGANQGVAGEKSDQFLARLTDTLDLGAEILVIAGPINDIVSDPAVYTEAFIKANLTALVARALAGGVRRVGVCTISPVTSAILDPAVPANATRRALLLTINDWIRNTLCVQQSDVTCIDLWTAYADTGAPTGITGDFYPKAGSTNDGLHRSAFGVWAYGAPAFRAFFRRVIAKHSAFHPFGIGNLIAAQPFAGTGGTASTRVSGSVPTGYTAQMINPGSSTCVASVNFVPADGEHPSGSEKASFTFTAVGAAAFEKFRFGHTAAINVAALAGKYVQYWVEVDLEAWNAWSNVSAVLHDGSAVIAIANSAHSDADTMPNAVQNFILQTQPFLLPAGGAITNITAYLSATILPPAASGTGVLRVINEWFGEVDDPRPLWNRTVF